MNWQEDIPDVECIDEKWPLEAKSFIYSHKNIPRDPHSM